VFLYNLQTLASPSEGFAPYPPPGLYPWALLKTSDPKISWYIPGYAPDSDGSAFFSMYV